MKRFVILGLPRSGTTYLATLLDSHPDLCCAGELFNPYAVITHANDPSDAAVFGRDARPVRAAADFFEKTAQSGVKAGGFKFMIGHNINVLQWLAKQPDIRIIYIRRHNKLAQVASLMKAAQTQEWAKTEPTEPTPKRRARGTGPLSLRRLIRPRPDLSEKPVTRHPDLDEDGRLTVGPRRISHRWHEFATYDFLVSHWLESVPNPVMRIDYRGSLRSEVQARVCSFLGVSPRDDLGSRLIKQGSNKVIDRFRHKAQIAGYFERRGLAHWLGEELDDEPADQDTREEA